MRGPAAYLKRGDGECRGDCCAPLGSGQRLLYLHIIVVDCFSCCCCCFYCYSLLFYVFAFIACCIGWVTLLLYYRTLPSSLLPPHHFVIEVVYLPNKNQTNFYCIFISLILILPTSRFVSSHWLFVLYIQFIMIFLLYSLLISILRFVLNTHFFFCIVFLFSLHIKNTHTAYQWNSRDRHYIRVFLFYHFFIFYTIDEFRIKIIINMIFLQSSWNIYLFKTHRFLGISLAVQTLF